MKCSYGQIRLGALLLFVAGAAAMTGCAAKSGKGDVLGAVLTTKSVRTDLQSYRGKVVILDFWATWCPPCRQEIPGFIELQKKYRDDGLEIIGVSLDPMTPMRGGASVVEPFMKQYKINYAVWLVNTPEAMAGYNVDQGIPTTYIIDRDGRIVNTIVGARPMSVFENEIKALL